jgi:hypothetical protein
VGVGGGGGGGGLLLDGGWADGACGQCIGTAGSFGPDLLGAEGLLDVGGVWVCVGLERPDEVACGGSGSVGCFLLDTGGVGTCLISGEDCLEIQESELSCNWGVPSKLASLSAAEVIACSTDHSNSSTLAVLSSDSLFSFSLSETSESSVSDALELLKCTVRLLRYFHLWVASER